MSDPIEPPLAEESVAAEPVPTDEPTKTEYVEWVGLPPFGTTSSSGHSVSAAHMKKYHDVDLGVKEASWTPDRKRRFLVKASDLTPEAVEVLTADPMFKLVEL